MTWGVIITPTFGAHSPRSWSLGYKKALEKYFDTALTEKEQNELNSGMGGVPWTKFSKKIQTYLGWLADHQRPERFRFKKTHKELCSLISLENKLAAIDIRQKEIIEDLEPETHQFWPIELTQPKDKPYPVPYFGMAVHSHLNCFRFEECDPGHARDKSIGDHIRNRRQIQGRPQRRRHVARGHRAAPYLA